MLQRGVDEGSAVVSGPPVEVTLARDCSVAAGYVMFLHGTIFPLGGLAARRVVTSQLPTSTSAHSPPSPRSSKPHSTFPNGSP